MSHKFGVSDIDLEISCTANRRLSIANAYKLMLKINKHICLKLTFYDVFRAFKTADSSFTKLTCCVKCWKCPKSD